MLIPPPESNARVASVARRTCLLRLFSGEEVEAVLRGKLFEDGDGITAGDHVVASQESGKWTVDEVLPRANAYLRKGLRKEKQVMFANADRVLIVVSLARPQTKIAAIDRFVVAAMFGKVPPLLVVTKTDLDTNHEHLHEVKELYAPFEIPILAVSNVTGEGIDGVRQIVSQGVSAIIGNSGVGKSSLTNSLVPGIELRVRDVSAWSGKGTHTTSAALLVPYGESAALIDTPGMKSFVPYGLTRQNLVSLFPDIEKLASNCRFRNCKHISEPDCAVAEALDDGQLPKSRFRSFQIMLSEVEEDY